MADKKTDELKNQEDQQGNQEVQQGNQENESSLDASTSNEKNDRKDQILETAQANTPLGLQIAEDQDCEAVSSCTSFNLRAPLTKETEYTDINKPSTSGLTLPQVTAPTHIMQLLKPKKALHQLLKNKLKLKEELQTDDEEEDVEDDKEHHHCNLSEKPLEHFSCNLYDNAAQASSSLAAALKDEMLDDVDDEDDEVCDIIYFNPTGSVLKPSPNPYNKQEKIREANIALFKESISENTAVKIKFNDNVSLLENTSSFTVKGTKTGSNKINNEPYKADDYTDEDKEEIETPDTDSLSNRSLQGLQLKGIDTKVLLVMVPSTNTIQDSISLQSDNSSSSENEDVCVGHSRIESSQESEGFFKKIIEINNNGSSSEGDGEVEERKEYEEEEKDAYEKYTSSDTFVDLNECLESLELNQNQRKNINDQSDGFSVKSSRENYLIDPENNTGIKIKITCPDCSEIFDCVKFCNFSNEIDPDDSDTENCALSANKSHYELRNSINNLNEEATNLSVKSDDSLKTESSRSLALKFHSVKHNKNTQCKNKSIIKNSISNISIKLNATNIAFRSNKIKLNSIKTNFMQKSRCHGNTKTIVKSSETNNTSSKQISIRKKNKLQKNKTSINSVFIVNHKEKLKQKDKNSKNIKNMNSLEQLDLISDSEKNYTLNKDDNICNHKYNRRPKSCIEQRSKLLLIKRPVTAPTTIKRNCCTWDHTRLPEYNGFRSEYGLSEEQLQERKRINNKGYNVTKL